MDDPRVAAALDEIRRILGSLSVAPNGAPDGLADGTGVIDLDARWQQAGKRLHALAPDVYRQVVALLIEHLPVSADAFDDCTSQAYFIT